MRQQAADMPQSVADMVALALNRRDLRLAENIRRFVRPVSVEPGRLRIGLADGAPADLTRQLAARLRQWTGQPWVVLQEENATAPTLAEKERARQDALLNEAQNTPAVRAVLEQFPQARILQVRPPQDAHMPQEDSNGQEA